MTTDIAGTIFQLAKLETYFLNQKLHDVGLNADQAKVLSYIATHPGTNQRQVGVAMSRGAASMSNLLKGLITRDLIVKQVAAGSDREKQLRLTERGLKTAAMVAELLTALESVFVSQLNDAESLNRDLAQLLKAMQ